MILHREAQFRQNQEWMKDEAGRVCKNLLMRLAVYVGRCRARGVYDEWPGVLNGAGMLIQRKRG